MHYLGNNVGAKIEKESYVTLNQSEASNDWEAL
jgi:hypothetical protein